jgi:putative ABC transport system permease protein
MNALFSFRIAFRALGANKLRAGLTMLGMIIGVGAVIAMVSVGKGAQLSVTNQIQSMGTNLLFIRAGAAQSSGVAQQQGTRPTLTYEDSVAIADDPTLPIVAVAPEQSTFAQAIGNSTNVNTRVLGTTPEYSAVRNVKAASGDFITKQNLDSKSLVAVLGSSVATSLFGDEDPVGQTVKISVQNQAGASFKVVGVLESKGGTGFGSQDDMILIPITTMQQRILAQRTSQGGQNVSTINVQVTSEDKLSAAVTQIGDLLRERHRVSQDDFTIQSQADTLATANQVTGVMTLLLGSIAGISLIVGGIGIMNIMLVSVTERTREVGIRKAVGARARDILMQFLVEAVVVSILGGSVGILLGTGLSKLVSGVSLGGSSLTAVVTPDAVLLASGVSAAIGVFFGVYPAMRAARLRPIEALRYE